jgi:N12 class adenine-specific DNA methylase
MKNIYFIHYDSPYADKNFMEQMNKSDISKKNIFIIDEVHNFINNVYNNLNMDKGKRAINIYNYIKNEKKKNNEIRIILLSGTPVINNPFELGLLFNLMRPGIFPDNEKKFNEIYLNNDGTININTINMF